MLTSTKLAEYYTLGNISQLRALYREERTQLRKKNNSVHLQYTRTEYLFAIKWRRLEG